MLIELDNLPLTTVADLSLPPNFAPLLADVLARIDGEASEMMLSHVLLFGSAARGEAMAGSDLDILLLTQHPSERAVRLMVIGADLDDDIGEVPVQITVRNTERFLDETRDLTAFHRIIAKDLKLMRRYPLGI